LKAYPDCPAVCCRSRTRSAGSTGFTGQGMSVAAQEARLLQHVLSRAASEPDPIAALQAGFMAEVASVLETPWGMSTGPDLAFPSTRGSRPENFEKVQQFQAALFRAAVVDPVVHRALTEVAPLLQSQSLLREPDIIRRIEAAAAAHDPEIGRSTLGQGTHRSGLVVHHNLAVLGNDLL
jgi:hypothetical protein